MAITSEQRQIIFNCQASVVWFLHNFGKIRHVTAGVLDFKPFTYQKGALKAFKEHRFTIFRKTRQCGISKISGAFALWFAMFHPNKTVLIVSRDDNAAINFLAENVKFVFSHLPKWMRQAFHREGVDKYNDHELQFSNGSVIRSLTSHQDVLRSNASSLNIIDEAAFIPNMGAMWAAGFSTMNMGGSCIVISTTSGVGGWYWATYMDAEAGVNNFHPLVINWWDMDWKIEYKDPLSGRQVRIAPTDNIRKCATPAEIGKYGPYWSPWLEDQYRNLQEKGEAWKFNQEVLARFEGSGNTVVSQDVINHIGTTIRHDFSRPTGQQTYVHPTTGEIREIDFSGNSEDPAEGLWIWKEPDRGRPAQKRGDVMVDLGTAPHQYVSGLDIATGKGRDYHALEIFDVTAMEQVAELMVRCLPRELKFLVDYLCRWYNSAMLVVERNNGGDTLIDDFRDELAYPALWRRKDVDDKPTRKSNSNPIRYQHYGFFTSAASKPVVNRFLVDYLRDNPDGGYKIYSARLHKQLQIYVRKKDRAGHDTTKTEAEEGAGNFDDLVLATGLAFIGAADAMMVDPAGLMPVAAGRLINMPLTPNEAVRMKEKQAEWLAMGNRAPIMPLGTRMGADRPLSIEEEVAMFARTLMSSDRGEVPPVAHRKHQF